MFIVVLANSKLYFRPRSADKKIFNPDHIFKLEDPDHIFSN